MTKPILYSASEVKYDKYMCLVILNSFLDGAFESPKTSQVQMVAKKAGTVPLVWGLFSLLSLIAYSNSNLLQTEIM